MVKKRTVKYVEVILKYFYLGTVIFLSMNLLVLIMLMNKPKVLDVEASVIPPRFSIHYEK